MSPIISVERRDGGKLVAERVGSGVPIVLVHGLTATRRYVVHGSKLLERSRFDVLSYDARGHGESDPDASDSGYEYTELVHDLRTVLDNAGLERALLAGASMGAATAAAFAIQHPERVSGLVQITPAHVGARPSDEHAHARWDALANGLETGGVDGFMEAYGTPPVEERFRSLVSQAIRQRLERHLHPEAVADAIRTVVRSVAFDGPEALASIQVPTLIVGSRDTLDPEHPLDVAERYEQLIPISELIVENPNETPLAWRGARLSRAIEAFATQIEST